MALKNSVMELNFEMNKFSKLSGCNLESKYKVKAIDTKWKPQCRAINELLHFFHSFDTNVSIVNVHWV